MQTKSMLTVPQTVTEFNTQYPKHTILIKQFTNGDCTAYTCLSNGDWLKQTSTNAMSLVTSDDLITILKADVDYQDEFDHLNGHWYNGKLALDHQNVQQISQRLIGDQLKNETVIAQIWTGQILFYHYHNGYWQQQNYPDPRIDTDSMLALVRFETNNCQSFILDQNCQLF